mmetsp:Transcript_7376/g.22287  ORF Transcript_7376/g.22287 Transcript_7376/m.22287 type:complete len:205 (-) Transcript_7376:54-668(-)
MIYRHACICSIESYHHRNREVVARNFSRNRRPIKVRRLWQSRHARRKQRVRYFQSLARTRFPRSPHRRCERRTTSCYCHSRSISARQTVRWVLIDTRRLRRRIHRLHRFASFSLPEAHRQRIHSLSLRLFYLQIQLYPYQFQLPRRHLGRLDASTWRVACISLFPRFAKTLRRAFRMLKSANFHPRRQQYLLELVPKQSHTRGR